MDPRIVQTRGLLVDAMEELVQLHSAPDITVSALCERAGVSRPTFYQHFRTTDEVLAAALEDRLEHIRTRGDRAGAVSPADVPRVLQRFLEEIWKDRHLYRALMRPVSPYSQARVVMATWLEQSVAQFLFHRDFAELDAAARNEITFAVGGVSSTVARWIESSDTRKSDLADLGPFLWSAVLSVTRSAPVSDFPASPVPDAPIRGARDHAE
ncbi:transcriptional regulator, TetR family [Microbacterium sp. RURRCA19A]|nr:transcriptional regulator, TetR family [Microbacterium sp. RURRCA19A]